MKTITRDKLKQRLDNEDELILVETLPADAFAEGHLPGALSLPPDQIDTLAPRLLRDKDADIVVYCASASCDASEQAADRLEEMGYTNIFRYTGGKADWIAGKFPLEGGKGGMRKAS